MRLRRVDCSAPGIRRQRRGRGFGYVDERSGAPARDRETLERIRSLVIPPAWRDVWICTLPNGHLQAVLELIEERKDEPLALDLARPA